MAEMDDGSNFLLRLLFPNGMPQGGGQAPTAVNNQNPSSPPFAPVLMGGGSDRNTNSPAPQAPEATIGQVLDKLGVGAQAPQGAHAHGIGGFFKEFLKQFALRAPQSVGDSLLARINPDMYKQEMEGRRQSASQKAEDDRQEKQLKAQQALHMMMNPYQQAELAAQSKQHEIENQLKLAGGIANGTLRPVAPEGTVLPGMAQQASPGTPQAPDADMLSQLQGLPQNQMAQTIGQAPKPFLSAGGLNAEPVPGATEKDQVEIDPTQFDPKSSLGKQFTKAGITTKMRIPAVELFKHFQDAAEKSDLLDEKLSGKKQNEGELQDLLNEGLKEIDNRFGDDYYKNLHHGKVDPLRANQADALRTQLQYAFKHDASSGSKTQVTKALESIRTYVSPWEKLQEQEYAKNVQLLQARMLHSTNQEQHAYDQAITELRGVEKPILDQGARFDRLKQSIEARNPAIDPVIPAELLTVVAGGAGSGVRVTDTELNRVLGGRSKVEDFKAFLSKWTGDGKSLTEDQRQNTLKFLTHLETKIGKKYEVFNDTRKKLTAPDTTMETHRKAMADFQKRLTEIDYPDQPGKTKLTLDQILGGK